MFPSLAVNDRSMTMDMPAYRSSDEGADGNSKCTRIAARLRVAGLLTGNKAQQRTNRGTGNGPDDQPVALRQLQSNFTYLVACIHKSSGRLSNVFIAGKF